MKLTRELIWWRILFSTFLMSWLMSFPPAAMSAEKGVAQPVPGVVKTDSPIHIVSDRMEVKQKENTILFEGHVIVKQDNVTITGNRMTVFVIQAPQKAPANVSEKNPGKDNMADRIERIEVDGDVKISQMDKIATADRAVYYHKEQKIVLMGHPAVSRGQDQLRGRLITLYLPEEKSVVEGGQEAPVEAVLYPRQKE